MRLLFYSLLFSGTGLLLTTCGGDSGINLFSIQQDVALGRQLRDQVLSDRSQFDILDPQQYGQAYAYVEGVKQEILQSGEITYAEEFPWEIYIVRNDEVRNAFATPGGFIFVYTGLLKYLDQPDDFAGVLAHEMAHADERHSTQQLTKVYGLEFLVHVLLGVERSVLSDVLGQLVGLKFSRDDEAEADARSVRYLCGTPYSASGTASFFEKMVDEGSTDPPEFLSTHPSPANRVSEIRDLAGQLQCDVAFDSDAGEWQQFVRSLP